MRCENDVPVMVDGAALSDIGMQRSFNEDRAGVFPELGLALVTDGMGGSASGEVAAEFTEEVIPGCLRPWRGVPWRPGQPWDAHPLITAIKLANLRIVEASTSEPRLRGIGCTVVAVQAVEGGVLLGWVGDSRCYRLRGGRLQLLSRDHSLINDFLLFKPDISADELAALPRNVITRALGMADRVEVELRHEPVEAGDVYLLCTDGLTSEVPDLDIERLLAGGEGAARACRALVQEANDRGGADNIGVALVRWG